MNIQEKLNSVPALTVINPCAKFNKDTKEFEEGEVTADFVVRDNLIICKNSKDIFFDYEAEFRGGLPWICEELETWAKENFGKDVYWEWENTSSISIAL